MYSSRKSVLAIRVARIFSGAWMVYSMSMADSLVVLVDPALRGVMVIWWSGIPIFSADWSRSPMVVWVSGRCWMSMAGWVFHHVLGRVGPVAVMMILGTSWIPGRWLAFG